MPQRDIEVSDTFVFTICNLRGLDCGWSAAPTRAIKDVQNSISTIPRAPSSTNVISLFILSETISKTRTHSINSAKRVAVCYAIPSLGANRDASVQAV